MDPTAAEQLAERLQRLEDLEEIRGLIAAYHRACDGGWGNVVDGLVAATPGTSRGTHDGAAVAELFVEDGVYRSVHEATGSDPRYPAAYGRAQIRRLVDSWQGTPWAIHYSTNPVVQLHGDRATGEFKGLMRLSLDGLDPLHVIYRGAFVRTSDGWRIESLEWINANEPSGGTSNPSDP
jgi:hypothetical protein